MTGRGRLARGPNGNTRFLLSEMLAEFERRGWRTRLVMLAEIDVRPCRGCETCSSGPCPQADEMPALLEAMHEADVIVIGSPVYWGDVTGQLKVFIDRSLPICDTRAGRKILAGKLGVSVAVRAGTRPEESLATCATIEHYFGHLGISPVGRLHVEQASAPGAVAGREDKLREARELAASVAEMRA